MGCAAWGMTSVCALCLTQSGSCLWNRRCAESWAGTRAAGVQGKVWGEEQSLSSPGFWVCILLSPGELQLDTGLYSAAKESALLSGINDISNVFHVVKKPTGPYSSKIWGFFSTVYSQLWAKLLFIHGLLDHEASLFLCVFYLVVGFFLSLGVICKNIDMECETSERQYVKNNCDCGRT